MKASIRIIVGQRWAVFAQQRVGMTMLGTVQRGMQIGALARLSDGTYAQVNGDVVETLNTSRVRHALRGQCGDPPAPRQSRAATAVVTIKRRRRIAVDQER